MSHRGRGNYSWMFLDSILVQVLHHRRNCFAMSQVADALLQLASVTHKHEQPDTVLRSFDKAGDDDIRTGLRLLPIT